MDSARAELPVDLDCCSVLKSSNFLGSMVLVVHGPNIKIVIKVDCYAHKVIPML